MHYEVARKESHTAEKVAKDIFPLGQDSVVSAIFLNVRKSAVLAVTGIPFYVPIAEKIAAVLEGDPAFHKLLKTGDSMLISWNPEEKKCTINCTGNWEALLNSDTVQSIVEILCSVETWGGMLNEKGELECDLKSPSPGPNYYTNMLLGNRIGFGNVLQCTPKSVVDRLGRGSFRSHADTQVLATRWDYLPQENGFPANRQFYLVENGKVIFYSADPSARNVVSGQCIHSQNHTIISYILDCGLKINRTIFLLPQKDKMPIACEAQMIQVENTGSDVRDLKLVYTGMLSNASTICLKEDVIYMTLIEESQTIFDEKGNLYAVSYHYNPEYEQGDLRFHTSVAHVGGENIYPTEFCFDYGALVGEGSLERPAGAARLNNRHVRRGPAFFAVSTPLHIAPGQAAQVDNLTCLSSEKGSRDYKGMETMLEEAQTARDFLMNEKALPSVLEEIKTFNRSYNSFLQIEDPDKKLESYLNNNLPFQIYYQNFVSRSFDQTQKGYREIGFREIQDLFASMFYWIGMGRKDIVQDFIAQWAQNVYKFGYANHNFFWTGKEVGVSSDDQLWLLQALDRYVTLTGDYEYLKTEIPMADGGKRSLLDTVKAIITYSAKISVGKHGLPLLDCADWNDCLRVDTDCLGGKEKERRYQEQIARGSKFGDPLEGEGTESIMNGFLLKVAVDAAANMFAHLKMHGDYAEMQSLSKVLYSNLQKNAWKGDFFCRLLFNRSEKPELQYLGAGGDGISANPEKNGTYYINSFAWSVLAGVATDAQIAVMLETLNKNLRTPYGFNLTTEVDYKKITNVVSAGNVFYGDRENGGVFKHANMMLAAAMVKAANEVCDRELAQRLADTAYWLVEKIVPYSTMQSPFTICGNPRFCTQVNNADTGENVGPTLSGTSSWLLITLTMLLGLHATGGKLVYRPLLRRNEKSKKVTLCLNNTTYHISIEKPEGFFRTADNAYSFLLDGKQYYDAAFPMLNDGRTHTIQVVFL